MNPVTERADESSIFEPGRNCSAVETARRATLLVDAESYFATLDEALRSATRTIFIAGWDFDGRTRLRPQDGADAPSIGAILRKLVEERPELEVRILVWSLAVVHTPSASSSLLLGEDWENHPRITLRLDTHHPKYAAHHQKIVVIDDSLAFVGGMDLTIDRWDTSRHLPDDPLRVTPDGEPCRPVHDVHLAVDGPVATAVAEVARGRWRDATGEDLQPAPATDRWPAGLAPDFRDVPIAVARTAPRMNGSDAVTENWALTVDMLRSAKRHIYIEAQYFTAKRLRPVLREILARDDPPEIVVVCPLNANGVIERFIMGANRERLLRSIMDADHAGRLKLYHAVVPGDDGKKSEVLIHSKLKIVDDRMLRAGSANLNNRSIALDTECDLVIAATGDKERQTVIRIRNQLLAEHLGCEAADVAAEMDRDGSMIAAIEHLSRTGQRHLQPLVVTPGPKHSFPGTRLLDPVQPFAPLETLRRFWQRLVGQGRSAAALPNSLGASSSEAANSAPPSTSGSRK